MSSKNYRKITVGDNFSQCIAYVKGAMYLGRSIKITDILPSETEDSLDIYVTSDQGKTRVLWKTIAKKQILETEYDLNFE
jgi:hypothetical protein